MKRLHWIWEACFILAATAIAALVLQSFSAVQAQEEELEGPIVQIAPAGEEEADLAVATDEQTPQETSYWIGLRGRNVDDPVLRTQLQLAEDMGVVIEDVVPESPAEKADLRKHDIILRANGDIVDSMLVLQDHVRKNEDKPLELLILRLGKEMTVTVTPAERPANIDELAGGMDLNVPLGSPDQALQRLLEQFQAGRGMGGLGGRIIGPGLTFNGQRLNFNAMPNGVSISIKRSDDGPAEITVKQGDKTWNFQSDDAKTLAELPQEVRQYVEGMLQGQGGGFDLQKELGNLDWQAELRNLLPGNLGQLPGIQQHEDEVLERMRKMEQQLEQLQQKLEQQDGRPMRTSGNK